MSLLLPLAYRPGIRFRRRLSGGPSMTGRAAGDPGGGSWGAAARGSFDNRLTE